MVHESNVAVNVVGGSRRRNRGLRNVEDKPPIRVIEEEVIDAALSRGEDLPKEVFGVESPRAGELWYNKPYNEGREFTHCRYTPCTVKDPLNFKKEGYRLRCQKRDIKVLICISMYAEDGKELDFTLRQGICKNIQNFKSPGIGSKPLTWENVAVVIVSDGRTKASRSTLDYAQEHGFFDAGLMEEFSSGKDTRLHLFEYSPQFHKKSNVATKFYDPVQVMFAVKEHNGGKLDSHYWFFNAFAETLKPEYTFLVDVGTMPLPRSIVRLYTVMETDSQVGGCCGEIAVSKPNYCNWTIAAQHFEYKVSNFMGKAMESLFGYITVLPGAFSAYRYCAIRGQPLQQYFYSINHTLSPFKANMYLAEDRILCLELLAKQGDDWVLRYEGNARAVTDVPDNLCSLIRQRRRWLNGSFFAQLYAVRHFSRVWTESGHSIIRCLFLTLEFLYFIIQTILAWFNVGTFYVTFRLLMNQFFGDKTDASGNIITNEYLQNFCTSDCGIYGDMLQFLYIFMLVIQVIIGLRNKPEHVMYIHKACSVVFGILNLGMMAMIVWYIAFANTESFGIITYIGIGAFASFLVGAVLHMELFSVLFSMLQYFFFLPTYVNIFTVYSLSNTHDVSWGTKGIETAHEAKVDLGKTKNTMGSSDFNRRANRNHQALLRRQAEERALQAKKTANERKAQFETYSSHLLIFWMLCNISFVVGIGLLTQSPQGVKYLTMALVGCALFTVGFQLIGSVLFLFSYYIRKCKVAIVTCLRSCCGSNKNKSKHTRTGSKSSRASKVPNSVRSGTSRGSSHHRRGSSDSSRHSNINRDHRVRGAAGASLKFDKGFTSAV